ncbi:MAG: transposase, partial [Prevotellaceae bacterium]|nr:transposase [Prevotellaceae bacterium]
KSKNITPKIIEKAFKNKPLTDEQKENNRLKSRTRSRVEHIYGFITNSMGDFFMRSIGFQRIKGRIGLINLVYNMCRYEQIVRLQLLPIKY